MDIEREITLDQELSIYNISSFKKEVLEMLEEEVDLVFDCSNLESIDAAGVQLILSLQKVMMNRSFDLKLDNLSTEVEETLRLAGIEEIIEYELRGDEDE